MISRRLFTGLIGSVAMMPGRQPGPNGVGKMIERGQTILKSGILQVAHLPILGRCDD